MTTFDQEIMARTAIGEARGEGDEGMVAVMWTILNRFTSKKWFSGQTLAGTALKYEQYDCWMPKDPNFALIINIAAGISIFDEALIAAENIITGDVPDPTQGATHYFDNSISPPSWTQGATKTATIGRLTFYKDVA